jgi:hypothetical protein
MSENNKFSLGGFPPIYEIVSSIKKKEFKPSSIVSIQSILAKRNLNRTDNEPKNSSTIVNKLKRHTNKQ